MEKKISVVIPTYKRLKLLFNCLNALRNQTISTSDFEVIVVSDGPDEDTESALRNYSTQVNFDLHYRFTKTKKGPAAARNIGWLSANAKLIAFTDDDCLPQKEWLAEFLSRYRTQHLVAYTGRTIVPISDRPTDFALNTSRLQDADFITANCACSKSALIAAGGFDEDFNMAWREDSDLEFKLLLLGVPIFHNDDAIVVHPVRNAHWGVSLKEQKKGIFDVLLYKKYPQLYRQKIQPQPIWFYYAIVALLGLSVITALFGLRTSSKVLASACLLLLAFFAVKRLQNTSKSAKHVAEMIVTSLLIPFVSIYWRIYGSIKYRKLLF